MTVKKKIVVASAVAAMAMGSSGVSSHVNAQLRELAIAQASPSVARFSQQDKTILYSGPDQNGVITLLRTGTATGNVNGVTMTNARFFLTGPTTYNFDVRTGVTDVDGDQLIYRATGSGKFNCPPLADVTSPPLPGPPQGIFGLGGGTSGTAVVTAATPTSMACPTCGKFVPLLGKPLPYREASYNPGNGCDPAQQFGLGTALVRVGAPSTAAFDFDGDGIGDIVTGAGAGGGPHVRIFSGADGHEIFGFFAYDPSFGGGVRVAVCDVNHDGVPDIITAPGPGGGPHVRVWDGGALIGSPHTLKELYGFYAYDPLFGGGVYPACAP